MDITEIILISVGVVTLVVLVVIFLVLGQDQYQKYKRYEHGKTPVPRVLKTYIECILNQDIVPQYCSTERRVGKGNTTLLIKSPDGEVIKLNCSHHIEDSDVISLTIGLRLWLLDMTECKAEHVNAMRKLIISGNVPAQSLAELFNVQQTPDGYSVNYPKRSLLC